MPMGLVPYGGPLTQSNTVYRFRRSSITGTGVAIALYEDAH